MSVTIQNLRLFVQIVDAKSFTAVSEKNFMTQSALSRMILSLEKELNVRLIDRSTRHFELTAEGRLYYQYACRAVADYDRTMQEIHDLKNSSFLRVGYNPVSGPPAFFIRALDILRSRCSALNIQMIRGYSAELFDMLDSGSLDCAFVSTFYARGAERYAIKPLQQIDTYALMRRDSPLNRPGPICIEELQGQEIIFMTGTAPHTRRGFYMLFPNAEQLVREAPPAEHMEDLIFSVRINRTIGITSISNKDGQYPDLVTRQLKRNEKVPRNPGCRALGSRIDKQKESVRILCGILDEIRENPADAPYPFES